VSFVITLLAVLVVIVSLLLIGLVLIQRGRGGGLAGAFGGAGGSSAFGTKAGDVFTRITIGVAAAWFIMLMLLVVLNLKRQNASSLRDIGSSLSTREKDKDSGSLLDLGKDKDGAIPPIVPGEGKSKADEPVETPGAPAPTTKAADAPGS
jgi:preprotein translocase subunit SecG